MLEVEDEFLQYNYPRKKRKRKNRREYSRKLKGSTFAGRVGDYSEYNVLSVRDIMKYAETYTIEIRSTSQAQSKKPKYKKDYTTTVVYTEDY